MATFVSVDDIHVNIKVNYGLCPGDPITIVVDNLLGGGGNPNNYYYNWFKKDTARTTTCYNYATTKRVPDDINRALPLGLLLLPDIIEVIIPFLNVHLTYGVPTPYTTVNVDLQNALIGFGRKFEVAGPLIMYYKDDDPFMTQYGCVASLGYTVITAGPITHNFTTGPYCVQPGQPLTRQICGWIPLAGGQNVDSFTVPSNIGTYMVEVVDEVGTPDYGIVDLNEVTPTCAFDTKNVSCNGKEDGTIKLLPFFDDSEGITFNWTKDNVFYSNQQDLTLLGPGTYCLTLTNSKGCTRTCCTTVTQPDPLVATLIRQINPSCVTCRTNERFGEVVIETTGGNTDCSDNCTSPYEYSVNDGEWLKFDVDNRIILKRLVAGLYRVRVRDCKCCYSILEFEIIEQRINITI